MSSLFSQPQGGLNDRHCVDYQVSLWEVVFALSETADIVNPKLSHHHLKVAYLSYRLGEMLGLSPTQKENLLLAGFLHDIGAFSLEERLSALDFDFLNPHYHAFVGYTLFEKFPPLSSVASIIRFHHFPWNHGAGEQYRDFAVPLESHILYLADRVSILFNVHNEPLQEIQERVSFLKQFVPQLFSPDIFEALLELVTKEYVWFDLASPLLREIVSEITSLHGIPLNTEEFLLFASVLTHLIDFRSPFTATHSTGIAEVTRNVGAIIGLSEEEQQILFATGLLHDLGKIAIPNTILDKPGPLSPQEMNIVKRHPYYTYQALSQMRGCHFLAQWASLHHEHLNGSGYPFKKKGEEIPFEARLLAASDVFSALAEDRPYRGPMSNQGIKNTLEQMVASRDLDGDIVGIFLANLSTLCDVLKEAQRKTREEYAHFRNRVTTFSL